MTSYMLSLVTCNVTLFPNKFSCSHILKTLKKIMDVDFKYLGFESSVIVGNNRNHLTLLRNWLAPVAKSVNSLWKRCWRASVDGWAASTFHSRCDSKGPTVTIIRVGRYIFGGYTSISWGK